MIAPQRYRAGAYGAMVPDDRGPWVQASEVAALSGWQPIETAPNPTVDTAFDSPTWKSFLVWCPSNRCTYLVCQRDGRFSVMGGGTLNDTPTHWRPLPEPPR